MKLTFSFGFVGHTSLYPVLLATNTRDKYPLCLGLITIWYSQQAFKSLKFHIGILPDICYVAFPLCRSNGKPSPGQKSIDAPRNLLTASRHRLLKTKCILIEAALGSFGISRYIRGPFTTSSSRRRVGGICIVCCSYNLEVISFVSKVAEYFD